jgi:hypothetical protein
MVGGGCRMPAEVSICIRIVSLFLFLFLLLLFLLKDQLIQFLVGQVSDVAAPFGLSGLCCLQQSGFFGCYLVTIKVGPRSRYVSTIALCIICLITS